MASIVRQACTRVSAPLQLVYRPLALPQGQETVREEPFRLGVEESGSGSTGVRPERAILVGVDIAVRSQLSQTKRAAAAGAGAALRLGNEAAEPAESAETPSPILRSNFDTSPGLDAEESLAEFRELVSSAGAEIAAELTQHRSRPDPATLIGAGKVEEIAGIAASTEADLVLFDHDLSPTQLRNLEAALPCRVLARPQLILDIFARHARTREGRLQVELAQLEYMLPRLTGRGKAMSA